MKSFFSYKQFMRNCDLIEKAINHFGITRNIKEAGYILRNGLMLDFSGRHYANGYKKEYREIYKAGKIVKSRYPSWRATTKWGDEFIDCRYVDHRELPDEWDLKGENDTDKMINFMHMTRASRYMPETGSMDCTTTPNYTQIAKVLTAHKRYHRGEPLYLDYTDPNTMQQNGTSVKKPSLKAIEEFYKPFEIQKYGAVHVKSYDKKDGIHVQAHDRRRPK